MQLLESITPLELASCVPFVKLTKIESFGKPSTDVQPVMFELISGPSLGRDAGFGSDADSYIERSLVSLLSLNVEFTLNYGQQMFREVTLEFLVHRPLEVFDRNSKVAWRQIIEEGQTFSLEYGWTADPTLVQNELFNGHGTVSQKGLVVKATQSILLNVSTYKVNFTRNGEARVTVKAFENGDLAMRGSTFSDAFERTFTGGIHDVDDADNVAKLKSLLDGLVKRTRQGRGDFYLMGEILDKVLAPMIQSAAATWGYVGTGRPLSYPFEGGVISVPPDAATLLLGKFNKGAGPQSERFSGGPMASRGIEDFMVPVDVLNDLLSSHFSSGRTLYLHNFISMVITIMNREDAWGHPPIGTTYNQPNVMMKADTVRNDDGSYRLVLVVYDVKVGTDPFDRNDTLALDHQSRADVMRKLASLDVPVLEFTRAGTLVTDANFELQPDPLLQAIQADSAYKDRKDRVQMTKTPDVRSRGGQARKGELIIPISILDGEVTMQGNFALEAFGILWIDFFGSPEISGVFHVYGKTDRIEPGRFTSSFKVRSESIDPLNTRRRRAPQE
jgi:hypothetical protein